MATSVSSLSDAAVTIVLIAMFVIVLVVARRALKETPLFGNGSSWVVAFCTAALSVLGLLRFLGPQEHGTRADSTPAAPGGAVDFILLPYAMLAIAILLVLLLLAWGKTRSSNSQILQDRQRVELPPEVKRLMRQRQPAPQTSLRKRLEK